METATVTATAATAVTSAVANPHCASRSGAGACAASAERSPSEGPAREDSGNSEEPGRGNEGGAGAGAVGAAAAAGEVAGVGGGGGEGAAAEAEAAENDPMRSFAHASHSGVASPPFDPSDLHISPTRFLGAGTYGEARMGSWHGQAVAVKILKNAADSLLCTFFLREVALTRRMHHPNIVRFLGAKTDAMPFMLVTEMLPMGDLHDYIQSKSPLGARQVLLFALDIARAMEYLHGLSPPIVHRDLKPHNLLLDIRGHLKLIDFGLATTLPPPSTPPLPHPHPHTHRSTSQQQQQQHQQQQHSLRVEDSTARIQGGAGCVAAAGGAAAGVGGGSVSPCSSVPPTVNSSLSSDCSDASAAAAPSDKPLESQAGTYRYMAPEVFRHEPYGTPVDVFSFAILLHEMFEGGQQMKLLTPQEVARKYALNVRPVFKARTYPPHVKDFIATCWDQDPLQRPPFSKIRPFLELTLEDLGPSPLSSLRNAAAHTASPARDFSGNGAGGGGGGSSGFGGCAGGNGGGRHSHLTRALNAMWDAGASPGGTSGLGGVKDGAQRVGDGMCRQVPCNVM
ncbi:unnamed protein product [Closterium sp. Naga37s-1]|nr:unnamed protein product [Closterium sp. Naga37s-1]